MKDSAQERTTQRGGDPIKMFETGDMIDICITHCEARGPQCVLWGQTDFQAYDNLTQIMADFDAVAQSLPRPNSSQDVKKGLVLCAKYSVDGAWYRARVVSIEAESASCFFLDYGNTDCVALSDLVIPPPKYLSVPFLANSFVAADLAPRDKLAWSEKEIQALNAKLGYTEWKLQISQPGDASNPPSVKIYQGNERYEPVLESEGIGSFCESLSSVNGCIAFNPINLQLNSTHDVCISHVDDSGLFHCQLLQQSHSLDDLMCNLQSCNKSKATQPSQGLSCIVLSPKDKLYHRGQVREVKGHVASVSLVDFGETEDININDIYTITPNYAGLPVQAVPCMLSGLQSFSEPKMVALLTKYNSKIPVVARVVNQLKSGAYEVELTDFSSGEPVHFKSLLEKSRNRTKSSEQLVEALSKGKTFVPPADVQVNATEDVYVTAVLSKSKFFGQLTKYPSDILDSFQDELQQHYSSHPANPLHTITPGDYCCTKFSGDGLYYRAKVIKGSGQNQWSVFYIDYGNEETKPAADLLELDQKFCNLPAQGIMCMLSGDLSVANLESGLLETEAAVHIEGKMQFYFEVSFPQCGKNAALSRKLPGLVTASDLPPKAEAAVLKTNNPLPTQKPMNNPTRGAVSQMPLNVQTWHEVLVSHIDDPENVFCQLSASSPQLDALMDHIAEHVEGLPQGTSVPRPSLGDLVLAQYSTDQGWYRAKITGILRGANKYEVTFVDYGNSDAVTIDAIRSLPSTFATLPSQAFCCRMRGLEPGTWSPSDVDDLWEFVSEKKLKVFLAEVDSQGVYTAEFFYNKGNINIIYGKKVARLSSHYQPSDPPPEHFVSGAGVASASRTQGAPGGFQKLELQKNKYADWQVSFSLDPGHFWCQLQNNTAALDSLMDALNEEYKQLGPQDRQLGNAQVGQPCCAVYSDDGNWYRAMVESVSGTKALVRFVDYGNEEEQPLSQLKALHPRFMELPEQAFLVGLSGARPVGGTWSEAAIQKFEELTADKKLVGAIISHREDGSYGVELCGHNILVHEVLVKSGLAVEAADGEAEANQRRLSASSSSSRASSSSLRSKSGGGSAEVAYRPIVLQEGQYTDVSISHSVSPSLFWCQLKEHSSRLLHLMNRLDSVYSKLAPSELAVSQVETNQAVCSKFSEDENWYRAEVLSADGQEVKVKYVDYGNEEWLDVSQIKQLKRAFVELPAQAVKCCLEGAVPDLGDTWSDDVLDLFMEVTEEKKLVATVKGGDYEAGYTVRLVDVSNEGEEAVIADKLRRHAAPKQTPPRGAPPTATIRRQPSTENANKPPRRQPSVEAELPWQPFSVVEMAPGSRHNVMVSWVVSPGNFFVQLEEAARELEQLSMTMYNCYQALKLSELNLQKPQPGQSCIAYYPADGSWYRGKLMEVRGQEAEVHYVDYGNTEVVPLSKVKQIKAEFNSMPAHAVRCSLHASKAKQQWSREECSQFEALVSQMVVCLVNGRSPQGYEVDLLTPEGESVSQLMGLQSSPKKDHLSPRGAPPTQTLRSPPRVSPPAPAAAPELRLDVGLQVGSTHTVQVANVSSVHSFDCQLSSKLSSIDDFQNKLEAYYSTLKANESNVTDLNEDLIVAAKFSDGYWYRAKIIKVCSPNSARVKFLDYGNTDEIQKPLIKTLDPKFYAFEIFSFECSLYGAPSSLPPAALSTFSKLAVGHDVSITIKDVKDHIYSVQMQSAEGIDVCAEVLKAHPVAVTPEPAIASNRVGVFVTSAISPSKFFIQRDADSTKIAEMEEKLFERYDPLPQVEGDKHAIKEGALCCARSSEDAGWYRAKILSLQGGHAEVVFVDYGNSESVSLGDLKKLSDDHMKIPFLATVCCLKGCKEPAEGWSEEVVTEFAAVTGNGEKLIHAVFHTEADPAEVSLYEGDHNIGAKYQNAIQTAPTPVFPAVSIPAGSTRGYVSHVESPSELYVQLAEHAGDLNQMMEALEDASSQFEALASPSINSACVAQFSEDNAWYRAKVLSLSDDNALLRYVDYGNCESVPIGALKALPAHFLSAPLAACCKLSGITASGPSVAEKLSELVQDLEMDVTFSGSEEPFTVTLTSETGCIKEQLEAALGQTSPPATEPPSASTYSLPPRVEGKHLVHVSHVESPSEFHLQLDEHTDTLNQMMEDLEAGSAEFHALPHPVVNFPCIAQFSEDNAWYRAKVLSIEGDQAKLLYVDYGNTEMVPVDGLKVLPTQFMSSPMSLCCQLKSVIDPSLSDAFLELIQHQELEAIFEGESEPYTVTLSKEGQCILELLEGHETAQAVEDQEPEAAEPEEVSETIEPPEDQPEVAESVKSSQVCAEDQAPEPTGSAEVKKPSLVYPEQILTSSEMPVFVTATESLSLFYVQLVEETDELDELMAQLAEEYDSADPLETVAVGQAVCAKYAQDGQWYRGRVTAVSEDSATILYVDYGNTEEVALTDVFQLKPAHVATHPPFALPCMLKGFARVEDVTEEYTEAFSELVAEKELTMKVSDKRGELHEVELYEEEINLSEQFSKYLSEVDVKSEVNEEAAEVLSEGLEAKETPAETQEVQALATTAGLVPGQKAEVHVSFAISPSQFWCQLVSLEDDLNTMMEQLKEHCEQTTESSVDLDLGSLCIAQYSEDESWYRAKVLAQQEERVLVHFYDYGNFDIVPAADLHPLPSSLRQMPPAALQCSLSGLSPVEDDWNSDVCHRFSELCSNKKLLAEAISVQEAKPDTEQFFYVKLLDLGCSIGAKLLEEQLAVEGDTPPPKSLETSGLSSVGDWNQFYDAEKSVCEEPELLESATESKELDFDAVADEGQEAVTEIAAAKSLDMDSRHEVYVAHVESCNQFWVQLKADQHALEKLSTHMQEWYETEADSTATFETGKHYAAQSLDDDLWYRAHILESSDELYKVHYIDYGNTEDLEKGQLRGLRPRFAQQPCLALQCTLQGSSEENTDQFHEMVSDKCLSMKVVGLTEVGVHEVQLSDMGMDVGLRLREMSEGGQVAGEDVKKSPEETDALCYPALSIEVADMLDVVATQVISPGDFWCQIVNSSLQAMMQQMHELFDPSEADPSHEWKTSDCCVARCALDQDWYRARILSCPSEEELEVLYVDYGNVEQVPRSDVRGLQADLVRLPCQAFKCSLYGVKPVGNGAWDEASRGRFTEMLSAPEEKPLQLLIKDLIRDVSGHVELVSVEILDAGANISDQLVLNGYAQHVRTEDMAESESDISVRVEELVQDVIRSAQSFLEAEESSRISAERQEEVVQVRAEGSQPSCFVALLKGRQDVLCKLAEQIGSDEGREKLTTTQVEACIQEGTLCAVKRRETENWCRGLIKSFNESDSTCQIDYVDFGDSDADVPCSELCRLPEDLQNIPHQAKTCCLSSAPAAKEWSEEAMEEWNNLISDPELTLVVTETTPSGVHKVHLTTSAGTNINQQMATYLSVDDLSDNEDGTLEEVDEPQEESFLEVSVCMENSLGDLPDSGVLTSDSRAYPYLHFTINEEVEVYVKSALDPDNIICLPARYKSELSELQKQLTADMSDSPSDLEDLQEGQPCAALFACGWVRGQILSLKDDADGNHTVEVYGVDEGSTEVVAPKDLKLLDQKYLELPEQALRCSLHGAKLSTSTWHPDAASTIVRLCQTEAGEMKKAVATVKAVDDIDCRLTISLTCDGTDIVENLITAQLVADENANENEETPADVIAEE